MKPGKIGTATVLSLLLVVAVQAVTLTEIPKLEQRVDELHVQNKEMEGILVKVQEDNEDIQTKNQQLEHQLSEARTEIKALKSKREVLLKEVQRLKKSEPVSTLPSRSGGQFKEVSTVGSDFHVTWYNYNSGKTATGVPPKDGITVAVDPSIIPYGTWVKLTFPDGTKMIRKAEDTGSAVKGKNGGKVIDIYSNASTNTLLQRGRTRGVTVTILKKV